MDIEWILDSRIYGGGGKYLDCYPTAKGIVHPESTAYAISLLTILYRRTNRQAFLERAKVCASYLGGISDNGAVPGFRTGYLYSFDTGIYISGLFDLFDSTGDDSYKEDAVKSLNWLCKLFDGEKFRATPVNNRKDWHLSPSVHLAKLAIPLLRAWDTLQDDKYKDIAIKLLKWASKLQQEDGRFLTDVSKEKTMVHPHCYSTEGFLFAYHCLNDKRYLEIAKKSAWWLSSIQNEDGSFYSWYPREESLLDKLRFIVYREKKTDATAQAIRIWKVLGLNEKGVEKGYRFLDRELHEGGLVLKRKRYFLIERPGQKIYTWPTFFYIHSRLIEHGDAKASLEIF